MMAKSVNSNPNPNPNPNYTHDSYENEVRIDRFYE